jgi:predicted P-loop ATPase
MRLVDSIHPKFDGIGFSIYGTDFAAFDIDNCRDPATGAVDPLAEELVARVGSYTEITPSGTGLRIIGHAKGAEIHRGKRRINATATFTVEVYRRTSRYITVTGNPYKDCEFINIDAVMEAVDAELESAKKKQRRTSKDGTSGQTTDIPQELRSKLYHKDAAAYVSRSELFFSFITGCLRKGIADDAIIAACLNEEFAGCTIYEHCQEQKEGGYDYVVRQIERARATDFQRNKEGRIASNSHNIRRALNLLGIRLSYDAFHDRTLITGLTGFSTLNDAASERLYLMIDEEFNFIPKIEFFELVLRDTARYNTFHPVRDYLASLQWDGVKRLDKWLVTYGGAKDTDYVRAVAAITLIAAVRRVRSPGCKFDEMLILENPQGKDKSSLLACLAVKPEWFSDDLPLNADSKRVIEQTRGRWIIEAADLSGMRRADIEHLKAMLSRQVDRARLAYGRMTTDHPRQFIICGTTNSKDYLKDITGNRRFWPVEVKTLDMVALTRDRDQLWAEAAHREAARESIRLDPKLWSTAAVVQKERTIVDPWHDTLRETLGALKGKLLGADAWAIVGMEDVGRRTQDHNERLGNAMKSLGWERAVASFDGKNCRCYARGTKAEREHRIYAVKAQTGTYAAHRPATAEAAAQAAAQKQAINGAAAKAKAQAADDEVPM